MRRLQTRKILRDASLLGAVCAVAILAPIAVGHAKGTKSAETMLREAEAAREAATEARRKMIDREIVRKAGHPWAATYYEGDGLGANIRISLAPQSGVAATWHGCLGLYGANLGAVVPQQDGALQLDFEQSNQAGFGGFPERLVPVRWGARRYLLKPSEMEEFAAAINAGYEPRADMHGTFLLADGDERKQVVGLPDLPDAERIHIRLQPVDARIVEVGELERSRPMVDTCDARYRIRMEVEDNALLHPGERLLEASSRSPLIDVVVQEASPGHASGTVQVFEVKCGKPDREDIPNQRWRLTTGAYDEVAANRSIAEASRD